MSIDSTASSSATRKVERELAAAFETLRSAASDPRLERGTRRAILDATEKMIIEGGIERLSMRGIAARVGISLASLQYHFPTRAELFRSFCDFKADGYGNQLADTLTSMSGDPDSALAYLVQFLLEDGLKPSTCALYSQLSALACYDDDARVALERHMALYLKLVGLLVARVAPSLTPALVVDRATAIVSIIEGFPSTVARSKRTGRALRRTVASLTSFAVGIAKG